MNDKYKVVLVGAGKLANHLGPHLKKIGHDVVQVYNKTLSKAQNLAEKLSADAIDDLRNVDENADIYIIAVSDDAIAQIAKELNFVNGVVAHTSGTTGMEVLSGLDNYGVFYPLQTFSENAELDMHQVPVIYEANNEHALSKLRHLAMDISNKTAFLNSDERKQLHVSAVFANNFTNHLWAVAQNILERNNIDQSLIVPLINETVNKIQSNPAKNMQTGPALRGDDTTTNEHLLALKDHPIQKGIYELLTHSIQNSKL